MRFPALLLLCSIAAASSEDVNVFPDRIVSSVTNYAHTYQIGTNAHTIALAPGDVADLLTGYSITNPAFIPSGSTNRYQVRQGSRVIGPGCLSFPAYADVWHSVAIRRAGSVALRVETSADLQTWSRNGFFRVTATTRPEP